MRLLFCPPPHPPSGPSTDPEKPKLIQERLELLKHADWCQWLKEQHSCLWSCSRPDCDTMRKVLEHMTLCKADTSCQVKHCASSRRIISENKDYRWLYIASVLGWWF
nr:CREB-binding protein-like [Paramormyrops kingsleyae]